MTNGGRGVGTLVPKSASADRLQYRAFIAEFGAWHEQRTTSMTALQDWLSDRPMDPRTIKTLIHDAIRGLSADEPQSLSEPTLMGRGLERC